MKITQLAELGMLTSGLPLQTRASPVPPPVYILGPIQPASMALGKALATLGYSHVGVFNACQPTLGPSTYAELPSSSAAYVDLAMRSPEAKFIFPEKGPLGNEKPVATSHVSACYTQAVRGFFSQKHHAHQLLELDVSVPMPGAQAENWAVLCEFLGLGYSIVERLNLWYFPQ